MKVKDALKEQAKSLLVPVLFLLAIGIVALTVSLIPEEEETAEVIPVSKYEGNGGELVLENDSVKFVSFTVSNFFCRGCCPATVRAAFARSRDRKSTRLNSSHR